MSTGKRNKSEMAPSFQKNRKNQDQKNEPLKAGDKAQPTAEQIRIALIIDTKAEDPTLKDKIKQVMDATKRSEDEVLTALHDCDNDPDAAVDLILEGGHVAWSTSTSKKKSKPPAEKTKDASNQNNATKNAINNTVSPAGEGEDWNESDNADENSNVNRVNSVRGKSSNRASRGGYARPFNKRGGGRPNSTRESFNRSVENNSDWSKGNFKPPRGRNFFKSNRNGPQKDSDHFDNKEISERLGQNENIQEKHDSGGSDWASDTSDHNKNNQNSFDNKLHDNKGDNKWQDDNYWGKNQSRGRGGGMRSRSYNSYNRQGEEGSESRGFQSKGGRGRGRYPGPRNRGGEGRGRWEDGGFRGRMSNGPSRGGWRGGRGSRSVSKHPIDTWNPEPVKDEEDWDQEEEIFTGVETKVFTPSSAATPAVPNAVISEPPKLIPESMPKEERMPLVSTPSEPVNTPTPMPTTGQQFLAQLTAANVPKSIPQSVFNEVHFSKPEISANEYGGTFGLNTYSEPEVSSESKQQVARARLPPPSKIPSSAVEMPPEVGSGIALLDVQFGALELEQPAETVPAAPPSPSPPPPAEVPAPPPVSVTTTDLPVYQRPVIQDLLATKTEPQPSSTYYQDTYQTQYPKTTHQTYSSSYTQPSYNASQSIYSAGLGTNNSLSNPYQTYSGQVSRHSALTSTTNSKELDMPTPSVNISPPSAKPKVVPVPPGVGPPALVNPPQYIVNQPYIQQPFYSLEDLQLIQGGRLPHVPTEYYNVSYTNPASSAPREFDTRFQTQDTSTSPAPPNPTPSQNQTLMNPPIPYFAYYGGSMIGNYQYTTPIYPIAPGSSTGNQHQTTNTPYGKTTGNYTTGPSYTGGGGSYDSQAAAAGGDYSKGRDPVGVSKVTQGVYQVSQSSATNNLSNIYSKTYDKHGFNCATPPPPPAYTLGSQSSLSGGYSAQGLFYSTVTPPHHQPLHQPIDTAQSRTQLGAPPTKPQPKPKYPTTPYWHQQN